MARSHDETSCDPGEPDSVASGLLESVTRLDVVDASGSALSAQVSQDFAYYKSFGSPGKCLLVSLFAVRRGVFYFTSFWVL